ncbi:6085_t:CDS:2, partial [Racocetra persica]
ALPLKLSHNSTWKKKEQVLSDITEEILYSLGDIWRNPAFDAEFAEGQNEDIYITDVIIPLIRNALKKLLTKKHAFLSTAKRQSLASASKRSVDGKQGKHPDIMLIEKQHKKLHELLFAKCFCLICNDNKKKRM